MPRLFLLSPARINGARAGLLLNPRAPFELARRFRSEGLPLGDIFAFASGLYFRGKLAYARRFAGAGDLVRVITSNAGLMDPDARLGPADLRAFGETDIHEDEPRYHAPLRRDAGAIAGDFGAGGSAILLGSIATAKYRGVLLEAFGARLLFPGDFVGRGDMSRGALLLRAARAGEELPYQAVAGAVFTGARASGAPAGRSGAAPVRGAGKNRR